MSNVTAKTTSPEISALRAFLLTNKSGSTAGAAKLLNVSQPAVSSAIRRLETLVGMPLFDRSSRPMQLTAAGRVLKTRVEPIVEDLDNLSAEIRSVLNTTEVDLRVGFSDTFGLCVTPFLMPEIISGIKNLTAYCESTPKILKKLLNHQVDIAVATKFPSERPEITAQQLFNENYLIVTPRAYEGRIHQVSDLSVIPPSLPVIRFNDDSLDSVQIERILRQFNYRGTRTIAVDTNNSAISLVNSGIGWTVMPPLGIWAAKTHLQNISLHRIDSLRYRRTFYVMYEQEAYNQLASTMAVKALAVLRNITIPDMAAYSQLLASSVLPDDNEVPYTVA